MVDVDVIGSLNGILGPMMMLSVKKDGTMHHDTVIKVCRNTECLTTESWEIIDEGDIAYDLVSNEDQKEEL